MVDTLCAVKKVGILMKRHTSRTLYDKWNRYYENKKERINVLKKRRETASIDELTYIESELEELFIVSGLIHEVLADVGIMAYQDEFQD